MKRGLALILLLILILLVGSIAVYAVDCSKINSELAEKIRDNIKRGMGPAAENIPKSVGRSNPISPQRLLTNLQVPKTGPKDFNIIKIKESSEGVDYLFHGTYYQNFIGILNSRYLKPFPPPTAIAGRGIGIHSTGVYVTKNIDYAIEYTLHVGARSDPLKRPVLLRLKNVEFIQIISGDEKNLKVVLPNEKGVPLNKIEVWDNVNVRWFPATDYIQE